MKKFCTFFVLFSVASHVDVAMSTITQSKTRPTSYGNASPTQATYHNAPSHVIVPIAVYKQVVVDSNPMCKRMVYIKRVFVLVYISGL